MPTSTVTVPNIAPLEDILPHFREIWSSKVLSNSGPFHNQLENALAETLSVDHLTLVSNATLGLMLAAKSLGLQGEVITTPFSFIATANSLCWAGLKPVFADIDPLTLTLDPNSARKMITRDTAAILPVHIFGRMCDTEAFENISQEYGIPIIYDAAQAFGIGSEYGQWLQRGEMSVVSFHATKVFNTVEGGAIISRNRESKLQLEALRNNGLDANGQIVSIGLNAKMSEIHAAVGLANLQGVKLTVGKLKLIDELYRAEISQVEGLRSLPLPICSEAYNYHYFPILVDEEFGVTADEICQQLNASGVGCKRYFSPLISETQPYRVGASEEGVDLPIAKEIASKVLCLPMHPSLTCQNLADVVSAIKQLH